MLQRIRDVVGLLADANDDSHDPELGKQLLTFNSKVGATCDLGVQNVSLTPGASSTCGGGNCSCCSSCCW